jgi:hypothetical protein
MFDLKTGFDSKCGFLYTKSTNSLYVLELLNNEVV